MTFSVIIPTYNREKDLKECINSILNQGVLPAEIIVIDDGKLESYFLENVEKEIIKKGISFVYYKKDHLKERKGTPESKNIGLDIAKSEIVFFFDDDVELKAGFFEKIMEIWEENKENEKLIGVGGWIENLRKQSFLEKIYNKIFGLSSKIPWDVNEVGFQVWDTNLKESIKCWYIHGGVSSYKREKIKNLGGFETFAGGRTALEDLVPCLKAKNHNYFFIITPEAKVIHKVSKKSRESDYLTGLKESCNRKIIFTKYCKKDLFHKIWFLWANFGWILRQFLAGNFHKGIGMIVGTIKCFGRA